MNHPKRRFIAWLGGVLACLVLVGAGIAYIAIGVSGHSEVNNRFRASRSWARPT